MPTGGEGSVSCLRDADDPAPDARPGPQHPRGAARQVWRAPPQAGGAEAAAGALRPLLRGLEAVCPVRRVPIHAQPGRHRPQDVHPAPPVLEQGAGEVRPAAGPRPQGARETHDPRPAPVLAPAARSHVHDHPCDGCWVKVMHGTVKETRYHTPEEGGALQEAESLEASAGDITFINGATRAAQAAAVLISDPVWPPRCRVADAGRAQTRSPCTSSATRAPTTWRSPCTSTRPRSNSARCGSTPPTRARCAAAAIRPNPPAVPRS